MELNRSFWEGKKVLITGHTGFKGSWLTLWLTQLGAEVIGFSLNPTTSPNLFELAHADAGITSITGDILDLESLKNTVDSHEPEIIFHLAAQSLVKKSYTNPTDTFSTNVMGTVNIFEASRQSKCVRAVVNVTSDKCYENRESPYWGYRENDPMGGYDPYSASKGCAELVTSSYRNSFFKDQSPVKLASVRAGNVIGGGDWSADRLIPDIVRAIESQKSIAIRNLSAIRPWQHVLEPLHGYLLLAQKLYAGHNDYTEAWNFGPKEDGIVSVGTLLSLFEEAWGEKLNYISDVPSQFHEAHFLKLDCSKASYKLNWHPKLNVKETVDWTAAWYKNYFNRTDIRRYTLDQIEKYMQL
ncbi:CDP-glucose 4,6-dehydratase [Paenibacillus sp. PvR052]|nr:CDP-glucose 4,6-dehydratase [Paenibacillus sp. PvP091]MBP1171467.1 CDP-glucose 4,6-dehydratase [Paenibacillus sp. PvR098]MBP2442495.1 CDP-glucose 4,6-dehydratase [Paenibacillus sp. PvP052]